MSVRPAVHPAAEDVHELADQLSAAGTLEFKAFRDESKVLAR